MSILKITRILIDQDSKVYLIFQVGFSLPYTIDVNQIYLENSIYKDSSDFGRAIYSFQNVQGIQMYNATVTNITGIGGFFDNFFYFKIADGGMIHIDSLNFYDCTVGIQYGLRILGESSLLSITNSNFTNVKVGNQNSLILTGTFHELKMINLTFSSILDQFSTDYDNFMVYLNFFNLTEGKNSTIENIIVEKSKLAFYYLNDIIGQTTTAIQLGMSNITYRD